MYSIHSLLINDEEDNGNFNDWSSYQNQFNAEPSQQYPYGESGSFASIPQTSDLSVEDHDMQWTSYGNGYEQNPDYLEPNSSSSQSLTQPWRADESSPSHPTSSDTPMSETPDDEDSPMEGVEPSGSDDKVCYGMIHKQDVKPMHQSQSTNLVSFPAKLAAEAEAEYNKKNVRCQAKFNLSLRSDPALVALSFLDGDDFGYLRENITAALSNLLDNARFEFEAIGDIQSLQEQIHRAPKPEEARVVVDIYIYGPRDEAVRVGDELSDQKLWLQSPDYPKSGVPYENPHAISFPEVEKDLREEAVRPDVATTRPRAEQHRLERFVNEVEGSLARANGLAMIEGDQRLKTGLLEHQKQALDFMLQRESGKIAEEFRLWKPEQSALVTSGEQEIFVHRITKTRSSIRPEEKGGGILADEMGMGKSLSALALVFNTLEDSKEWARKESESEHNSYRVEAFSHSTLVIVPSALLINNWSDEIKIHTGTALKVIRYHGQGRPKEVETLKTSDIVITTYNTLVTDLARKKSPLHKIAWYRVILDEAHYIRRQSTKFYIACSELEARSRWCLTGTPIQNRLEDIGSLFAFLRVEPFDRLNMFRRFICLPFENPETEDTPRIARERLIMLYDSLVLRRTKDILTLPEHREIPRELRLSPEEAHQLKETEKILNRRMRTQSHMWTHSIHEEDWKTSQFGLFQVELQLRILCNHGTFQKPWSWERPDVTKDEREALPGELSSSNPRARCDGCKQPYALLGSAKQFDKKCQHVFCHDCIENYMGMRRAQGTVRCPLCSRRDGAMDIDTGGAGDGGGEGERGAAGDNGEAIQDESQPNVKAGKERACQGDYFNETGVSTKMNYLMADVQEKLEETKSIIFSCWTKTLDLVERHLKKAKIGYERIDGEVPLSKRARILQDFATKFDLRVLLMTTGTGAFGLNLTAANRIFIVEPQWNPSVENQAIARAIRLRQDKEVTVTRYVILGTIEEQMRSQQQRKREAAAIGFERREPGPAQA